MPMKNPPHPGLSVRINCLEPLGLSVTEGAKALGVSRTTLSRLLNADAGISAWECKYFANFWRPITAIREAGTDGNPGTAADPAWTPLGAQADNGNGTNFTPPFPAYTSGHATFGAAAFRTIAYVVFRPNFKR